ncbi:polyadenylate-binding protein 7-like [Rutidosis leptorrhynchoides]|uniref:polyadenylate-binding protein 7-like n=1 Tax=Rutidosis leptorrhynchoides TaxID=125765 RepID=UPI003A9A4A90
MQELCALYVGDLHSSVTEANLISLFSRFDGFRSAFLCRHWITRTSLCYGYVNFDTLERAIMAMKAINYEVLNGQRIRVMLAAEARSWKDGIGNVFVKNLEAAIDSLKLHDTFSRYGRIISCKVALTPQGTSEGYGYVQFQSPESADTAIREANGSIIQSNPICVEKFIKKSERSSSEPTFTFNNLYVKNLDSSVTTEMLRGSFSEFGKITSLVIQRDINGISKGYGFVCFENPDDAKRAMEALNGTTFGSKTLYVARAQKKAERQRFLRSQYEERRKETKGLNLYVKNIVSKVNEEHLRNVLGQCGRITSIKIMRDDKGISRGFGFVCFSTREEANNAIHRLRGILFHGKSLYVSIARSKEERAAYLQTLRTTIMPSLPWGLPPTPFPIHPPLLPYGVN